MHPSLLDYKEKERGRLSGPIAERLKMGWLNLNIHTKHNNNSYS